jgi:hypothetical protein
VRVSIFGGSTIDQKDCTATADTQAAADRAAHQLALDYLVERFQAIGQSIDAGTRDAYLDNIAKENAWLAAAKAGRQTTRGAGGHWPDNEPALTFHMSGEARYRFYHSFERMYAWGFGASDLEAKYYQYHSIAQQLALRIRRETDEKKRADLQEASTLLADMMQKQFTKVVTEQTTWKETQQALQDILDPETSWREAPKVAITEPVKPPETPDPQGDLTANVA